VQPLSPFSSSWSCLAGGASGGSIYIVAAVLRSARGTFLANGGNGGATIAPVMAYGNGGSGGRISFVCTSSVVDPLNQAASISAIGGLRGNSTIHGGSPGTIASNCAMPATVLNVDQKATGGAVSADFGSAIFRDIDATTYHALGLRLCSK